MGGSRKTYVPTPGYAATGQLLMQDSNTVSGTTWNSPNITWTNTAGPITTSYINAADIKTGTIAAG